MLLQMTGGVITSRRILEWLGMPRNDKNVDSAFPQKKIISFNENTIESRQEYLFQILFSKRKYHQCVHQSVYLRVVRVVTK
jgi:hypothetical protein